MILELWDRHGPWKRLDWPDAPEEITLPVLPPTSVLLAEATPQPELSPVRRRIFRRDAGALATVGLGPVCYREVTPAQEGP